MTSYRSESASAETVGNVMLLRVHGRLTVRDLNQTGELHRELQQRYAGGTVSFTLAPLRTPLPDAAERQASAEWVRRLGPGIRAAVIAVEGDGFWAAAARSAITAIYFVARPPFPYEIVSSVREGVEWCRYDLEDVDAVELETRAAQLT